MPAVVHTRVQALLRFGPPACAATLAGTLIGIARKLAVEAQAPVSDFVVLSSLGAAAATAVALFSIGAARVRRGAHTDFPSLWRAVPWTTAAGFVVGLIAAGSHALLK